MIIPPPRNCSAAGDSAYRKSSMNWNPPVSGLRRCQPPLARGPFGADWGLQAPKPPLPKGGGPPPKAVVEGFRFQEICRAGRPGPPFNYGSLRMVKSPPPGGGARQSRGGGSFDGKKHRKPLRYSLSHRRRRCQLPQRGSLGGRRFRQAERARPMGGPSVYLPSDSSRTLTWISSTRRCSTRVTATSRPSAVKRSPASGTRPTCSSTQPETVAAPQAPFT